MGAKTVQPQSREAWAIARAQHWVISLAQLLALGFTRKAIEHRTRTGRLHRLWPGVYAVGRPGVGQLGTWMAASLTCGDGSMLIGHSAAELYAVRRPRPGRHPIAVSVPATRRAPKRAGITVRRRALAPTRWKNIPVTTIVQTIVDCAAELAPLQVEAMINEADALDLISPDPLRAALDGHAGEPGVKLVRRVLDRDAFVLTDSDLERLFLPIAYRVGLPRPLTQVYVNGHRVDFYWPELGLVVECDSLRHHRTAAKQRRDIVRDQDHFEAEMTAVRFTHWQIAHEPHRVERILRAAARRCAADRGYTAAR